ncbi:MAG: hypothetical protein M1819_001396 [Sarea resinae]|nr:MAG: hypothetical protein M1819_001396 [Sarea resinae]
MFNWAKQQLANVAGTVEPIYGAEAIHSVANQTEETPYTELTKDDLKWVAMDSTCVETQTFYLFADSGHVAFAQVIYNNVSGIRTTVQFNTKIFYPDGKTPLLWSSDPLEDYGFDEDQVSFFADNVAITLSDDATSYEVKSASNENSIVNFTMTRTAPGFQVGKNGTTYYGTDPDEPWGSMRHVFWPRNDVVGTIVTPEEEIDFKGKGYFVYALQGMKPHHAGNDAFPSLHQNGEANATITAARWNFVDFQSPSFSATLMEFTTPIAYGCTTINVGGVARDGEILAAGSNNSATHIESKNDDENDWPEPLSIKYEWKGKTKDGKDVTAVLAGPLEDRLDRIDVMAEVPGFVKMLAGSVVGTKPYIYQYCPRVHPKIKIKIGDEEEKEEEGTMFAEATFISDVN